MLAVSSDRAPPLNGASVSRRPPPAVFLSLAAALLLGACAGPPSQPAEEAADWSRAETLDVRLVDDRFEPSELVLRQSEPYRLRLANRGKELHEFTAPAFFRAARVHERARVLAQGSEVVVHPGETREVELVAPAAGTYNLFCADHDWAGMTGRIVVR